VAGTTTLTLPAATDTLVGRATTDTLTNKTLTGAAMNGTVGATTPDTGAFTTLSATGMISKGTTTGAPTTGDDLVLQTTGYTGITLFGGAADASTVYFRNQAAPTVERGYLQYDFATSLMTIGSNTAVTGLVDISAASSGQIKFPATQNASSDANTVDDYEEGTWTPTVAAASVTYTQRVGIYTKIGNVVYISCYVQIATITSPTGGAGSNFISGLPFTSLPFTSAYYPNFATSWNGSNFGGTVGMAQMASSSTGLSALASTNNAAFVDSSPADIWDANGNSVKITGFYFV
jgi:hypothetical protein